MCAAPTTAEADEPAATPQDGGYGWVIVAASFVVNLISDGLTFSFGIILTELFADLDNSREEISWIGSLLAGVPLLLGPITSVLIDKFGCRKVTMLGGLLSGLGFGLMFVLPDSLYLFIVSAGLLAGAGLGLCYMPSVVEVAYYFLERRSLATGISGSGSGVGTVLFAYVVRTCIEEYSWRGAFLLLGGLMLNIMVCGALFRPLQQQQLQQAQGRKPAAAFMSLLSIPTYSTSAQQPAAPVTAHSLRRQILPLARGCRPRGQSGLWVSCPDFCQDAVVREQQQQQQQATVLDDMRYLFTNWNYLGFLASNFLLYFWYDITYTFLPDHAKDLGISTQQVSLIVALIGVANTIGQIVIGFISDSPRVNSVVLYVLCIALTGVTNCLVPLCRSAAALLVYALSYGFLISANYSLCSIVLIELFGLNRLNTGYGFMLFFQGLANLLGPPLMGHMRDSDTNYNRAFIVSGIFVAASNLLIVPAYAAAAAALRSAVCCEFPKTQQQQQQKQKMEQLLQQQRAHLSHSADDGGDTPSKN